jgi:methyl-accepting chemotaxis protein
MKFERIETKLIGLITVTLIALLAVSMFLVIHTVEGNMKEDFNRKNHLELNNLATIAGPLINEFDFNAIERELNVALADEDIYYIVVTDEKGTLIRSKFKSAQGVPVSSEYLVEEDKLVYFNGVDVGRLQIGFSLVRINQKIRRLELIMTLLLIGSFLVLSIVIYNFTERLIIKPINELTDGVIHISEGDFSYRIPTERNDQFGELTRAFNQMGGDLESKTKAMRSGIQNKSDC